jgi:TPR repeat protein
VWKHAWGESLENRPEAIKWYRKAAEHGDATAGVSLGFYYYYGLGVSRDISEGVKWYKFAAEHGVMEAARYLGMHYDSHGALVPHDWKEAEKWFRMAAEKGDGYSASVLSQYFKQPDIKRFDEAIKWCRIAIDSGIWDESRLVSLEDLKKRDDDYKVSFEAHRKAAEQGDAIAQFKLGFAYAIGTGTSMNSVESAKWLRRSADQGNTGAQGMLGMAYANGEGVPKDQVMAYMWLNLAAASGKSEIKKQLDELTRSMSKEEVAEGQRMTREWKPKQSAADH